ncbi:2-dehydropantoate 2-reductase [Heyndrickxia ginsengihumi]|uniref:2-dehydropantoate 2-reductase n=2 Tax=Heyndrickxia ginsengihumi TaxID=363870 RepID=UPI00047200E3|nr:2-dehydropantoate 2-reductase [Heyndrickxia ginsengihumi]
MKIGIIGAGSLGLLYGGYLATKHAVTMFPRSLEQAEKLCEHGITVCGENCFQVNVLSTMDVSALNEQDVIFVTVKQYHLMSIVNMLKNIETSIPLVFLQNGMGHLTLLETLPQQIILVGTVEHGATRKNEMTVSHNGVGKTNIAFFCGHSDLLLKFFSSQPEQFKFVHHDHYELMLLHKCFANAMINPLTAILKVKNGELIRNSFYYKVFQSLFEELISLFPQLDREAMYRSVKNLCLSTKENESSMLKDIKKGSKTEIDAILGYMLGKASEREQHVPIMTAIYQIVKGMELDGTIK